MIPFIIVAIIVGNLVSGCATTYGPLGHQAVYGGYTDTEIGKNKRQVTFYANNFSSLASTQAMAYQRVREVCQSDDFEIIDQEARPGAGNSKSYQVTFSCN
jgi:hypothetical protein